MNYENIPHPVLNENNPAATDVSHGEAAVGAKRSFNEALVGEHAVSCARSVELAPLTYGAQNSVLMGTIVSAVVNAIPAGPAGPAGPPGAPGPAVQGPAGGPVGAAGGVTPAELQAALATLQVQQQLVLAQLANDRIRRRNQRLVSNVPWIPLQREVPSEDGGVPVGSVPPAHLFPSHNSSHVLDQTESSLQSFRDHYGVHFENWTEFLDYLQY
eukprot:gene29900-36105_t